MKKLHCLFVATGILVVLLVLDIVLKETLLDTNSYLTMFIQLTSSNSFTDCLFLAIDRVSLWLLLLIPLYCLSAEGLKTGLPLLAIVCIAAGVSDVLKTVYSEERPYWAYPAIFAIRCTKGFGNPSGHSLLAAAVYGLFAYFSFKKDRKVLAWCLLVGIVVVGVDRVYLGVHSYNQVLLGWGFGAVLVFAMLLLKVSKGQRLFNVLLGSHGFAIVATVLCVLVYNLANPDNYWKDTWSATYGGKCGTGFDPFNLPKYGEEMMWHAVKQVPGIFLFPGFVMGLYLADKYQSGDYKWTGASLRNVAVRLVFGIVEVAIVYVIVWAVGLAAPAAVTALVFGILAYAAGATIAYVMPMLKVFPQEDVTPLSEKLVVA